MNNENAVQVINHIMDHPEQWDQRHWHCGTAHCVGGHAQIMSGKEPDEWVCRSDAQEWLELTDEEADWLFDYCRTLPELHRFISMSVQGIEFDKYGFNRHGYAKDGFKKDGFNEYGFKIFGYDKDGFNKLPRITITEQTNEH